MKESKTNNPTGFDLWQQVCTTDPKHTKKVNSRGGFTAINATYQMREATQVWGSYGSNWGVRDLKWDYIRNGKGDIIEIVLEAIFYYPGKKEDSSFPLAADCLYKPGQDCRKKLLTDFTTKCLSKLGFNADVFLGLYDDNKYINQVKEIYRKPEQPASVKGAGVKKAKVGGKAFESLVKRIGAGERNLIQTAFNTFELTADQKQQIEVL